MIRLIMNTSTFIQSIQSKISNSILVLNTVSILGAFLTSNITLKVFVRKYIATLLCIVCTSCTTYSSNFTCPDSRGARCTMLSDVDIQIDSGEIETAYLNKCKGANCKKSNKQVNVPKKSLTQTQKITLEADTTNTQDYIKEEDNLYLVK